MHHVLGNHDYDVRNEKKKDVYRVLGMPAPYHAFEYGNFVFIILDGNEISYHAVRDDTPEYQEVVRLHKSIYKGRRWWNGAMKDEQIRWLDDRMTQADQAGKRVVVFNHYPILPDDGGMHTLWNDKDVLAVFERHPSATAWINGHNHAGDYAKKDGIHYVTLKALLDTERTAFSIIEFSDDFHQNKWIWSAAGYGVAATTSAIVRL